MFCSVFATSGDPFVSPNSAADYGPVWAICCRFGLGGHFQPPGQVLQNSSGLRHSSGHLLQIWPWWQFSASWPGAQPPGQVPQNPSRMTFSMGFRPSSGHLLQIWPRWPFSDSWPGAPEPLQNFLFDGIPVQFRPFAADLALVTIFNLLARCPRPPPE